MNSEFTEYWIRSCVISVRRLFFQLFSKCIHFWRKFDAAVWLVVVGVDGKITVSAHVDTQTQSTILHNKLMIREPNFVQSLFNIENVPVNCEFPVDNFSHSEPHSVRAMHRIWSSTMAQCQRKIFPTARKYWCPTTSLKWVNFVTTEWKRLYTKLKSRCQSAFNWGDKFERYWNLSVRQSRISPAAGRSTCMNYEAIYNHVMSTLLLWSRVRRLLLRQTCSRPPSILLNDGVSNSVFMP